MMGVPTFLVRMTLRLLFGAALFGASLVTFSFVSGFADPLGRFGLTLSPIPNSPSSSQETSSLAQHALDKVLQDARPIFGGYAAKKSATSEWMKAYPDETQIVRMNIPGTHDAATWNYSLETQTSLSHATGLVSNVTVDPSFLRCQQRSMADMLNAGIRAFDLRYAFDVANSSLVFWHGQGLQSQTATVADVLFGFYRWLDDHPSEALFLSFQYEGSAKMRNFNSEHVQLALYDTLNSPAAREYILQTKGSFGTLGQARGKITLLRRFDLDLLPPSYEHSIPGVHFSPSKWTPNGNNITLVYNEMSGSRAFIQDYFQPLTPDGSTAATNIQWKYNATTAHLRDAAAAMTTDADSQALFWGFASSTNTANKPPDTPRIQALGNGSLTPDGGVNQRLMPFLEGMKGKRLGVLMLDFYDEPAELVPLFLSLLPPP